MSDFQPVPLRKLAGWQRRALTIHLKAQDLLGAMIAEIGTDNTETDYADGVVEQTENLTDFLDRWHRSLRALASKEDGRS